MICCMQLMLRVVSLYMCKFTAMQVLRSKITGTVLNVIINKDIVELIMIPCMIPCECIELGVYIVSYKSYCVVIPIK